MEACPKNTTNLTRVYKMDCNRCVRVDRSALAFGLGVGRRYSPRRRYCYQLCHTMYLGFQVLPLWMLMMFINNTSYDTI